MVREGCPEEGALKMRPDGGGGISPRGSRQRGEQSSPEAPRWEGCGLFEGLRCGGLAGREHHKKSTFTIRTTEATSGSGGLGSSRGMTISNVHF